MPRCYSLGPHFEAFVQGQLVSGRYQNVGEVLRSALRLMEEHESRRALLDASIERGLADIEAGHVFDADMLFDELEARYENEAQGLAKFEGHVFW